VSLAAGVGGVGTMWADRRDRWRGSRFVEAAAARSFGVFLVHPAILWLLTTVPDAPAARPQRPWETVLTYVVTIVAALTFVEIVRRTPLRLALTGKPRRRPRPAVVLPGTRAGVTTIVVPQPESRRTA